MLILTFRRLLRLLLRLPSLLVILGITITMCVGPINHFQGGTTLAHKKATSQIIVSNSKSIINAQGGSNTKTDSIDTARAASGFTTINWSTVEQAPDDRSEAQGGVMEEKLYVFGGYLNGPFRVSARADVYNPATNTWKRIKDLPKPLTHSGTAVDGNKIYLAGGYEGKPGGGQTFATKRVWKYNLVTNNYSPMPPLPQARGGGALARLGRELHFFGGSNSNRVDKGDHWVLNLDGGKSWTRAVSLPNPTNHLGDATPGGKIYAIGGQRGQDAKSVTQKTMYVWDPSKPNTWTAVADLPRPRSHIAASTFVMDGRIIVIGGEIAHEVRIDDVIAYNPLSNRWQKLTPLPEVRKSGVAGSIRNKIFYATGYRPTTYKGVPVP